MVGLLGPDGSPIKSQELSSYTAGRTLQKASFKKDTPRSTGPSAGLWNRDFEHFASLTGSGILQFDLSQLTLSDYRMMRYNSQINASLSLLTFMVHQVDWHIESTNKKMAQTIEDMLRPMWTRLVRALSQSFWAGYSPIAIEYENNVRERRVEIGKFKDLHPELCEINWKKVRGSYAPSGHTAPEFRIYDGFKEYGVSFPYLPENTLWYPLLMENGNMYGRKLLKAAFEPWYFSTLIHLFANRYYERFGEPIVVARYDPEGEFPTADGTSVSGRDAMAEIIMNLRHRSVVNLPNSIIAGSRIAGDKTAFEYDIDFLESQMRGADFERHLTRLDEEMSLALFTPLLLMRSGENGSHNLGVQHTQTWLWMLNAITSDMKEYIDRYVIERLKAFNFSPKAEKVEWMPRKLGKENVETLRAIVSGLISGNKIKPDVDELGVALGMKLTEVKEVTRDDPNQADEEDEERNTIPQEDNSPRSKRDGPRGTDEARATGRQVAARVERQLANAWARDQVNGKLDIDFGFRRRFVYNLTQSGMTADDAQQRVDAMYKRLEVATKSLMDLGKESFSDVKDFANTVTRIIDSEVSSLVEED